jgi:hypothetical protein
MSIVSITQERKSALTLRSNGETTDGATRHANPRFTNREDDDAASVAAARCSSARRNMLVAEVIELLEDSRCVFLVAHLWNSTHSLGSENELSQRT